MKAKFAQDNKVTLTSFDDLYPFLVPKIVDESEIKRPQGYSLPGYVALSVTAEAAGFTAIGYGEGLREVAREKAISEAFERLTLFLFRKKTGIRESSNGWAAHVTRDLAVQSAISELIERDVALNAWETGGPFLEVPEVFWPDAILLWKTEQKNKPEFFDLHVLLSSSPKGACISVLLFNGRSNFVAGHSSAYRIQDAILSATNECFRAAHAAIQFEHFSEAVALHAGGPGTASTPEAHFVAYAYNERLPDIVKIESGSEFEIRSRWNRHQDEVRTTDISDLDVRIFRVDRRFVARVKSPKHRQIFWGRTNDLSKPNLHPHFVG